jgi:hypothetical protein
MHGVFEFGDVGVLRNVVDRCGGQTEADLAVLFVVQIDEAMPDIHRSERILRVVVVELIEPRRIREGGFYFQTVAARPIAGDLGRTFQTEARRLVVVVDAGIGVRFYVVIPPQNGAVDLSIEGDRDFFIALADGGRLELSNPILKIGAAIAAKIGGFRGRMRVCAIRPRRQRRVGASTVPVPIP